MSTRPLVFVSWAHSHRDWSAERVGQWRQTVGAFADLLADCGIGVEIDLNRQAELIDWTRYGTNAAKRADLVLMIGSRAYWERWEGVNPPDEGAGVTRETDWLHGLFDHDRQLFQRKVLIALLPGESIGSVPFDLRRVPCCPIPTLDSAGMAKLREYVFGGSPRHSDQGRFLTVESDGGRAAAPAMVPSVVAEPAADDRLLLARLCRDYEYLERDCRRRGADLPSLLAEVTKAARDREPVAAAVRRLLDDLDPDSGSRGTPPGLPGRAAVASSVMVYVCPLDLCDRASGRVAGVPPRCHITDQTLVRRRMTT